MNQNTFKPWIVILIAATICLALVVLVNAQQRGGVEKRVALEDSGYRIIDRAPYIDFDECTWGKSFVLEKYRFECSREVTYSFYGPAVVMAPYQALTEAPETEAYLCEAEGPMCFIGRLYRSE